MNIELIRQNLDACEKEMKNGSETKACEMAFLTARMLISQTAPVFDMISAEPTDIDVLRKVYIAYVGVANELNALFVQTAPYFDIAKLPGILKERIAAVNEMFERKREELNEEEKVNEALLQREEVLRQEEKKLKEIRDKVRELKQLSEEISLLKAELDENSVLIRNMPDTVGIKSVDDLIKYAKSIEPEIEEKQIISEKVIDQILEEIERIGGIAEKQVG